MQIRVLFFGPLKGLAGGAEQRLEVGEGARLQSVFDHYAERLPRMRQMAGSIVMARNRAFAAPDTVLADGDEVAFLPPVSGGANRYRQQICESGNFYGLTREPIEVRSLAECILKGSDGALVTFEGVVRNNTNGRSTRYLEYEGYEPMAIRMMAEIGRELGQGFAIGNLTMVHRLGRLLVGETSVAILVAAPHREAAFAAALEGINRIKRRVPVWKKEFFADGEVWVEGEWDQNVPRIGH